MYLDNTADGTLYLSKITKTLTEMEPEQRKNAVKEESNTQEIYRLFNTFKSWNIKGYNLFQSGALVLGQENNDNIELTSTGIMLFCMGLECFYKARIMLIEHLEEKNTLPPNTHNLKTLAERANIHSLTKKDKHLLNGDVAIARWSSPKSLSYLERSLAPFAVGCA